MLLNISSKPINVTSLSRHGSTTLASLMLDSARMRKSAATSEEADAVALACATSKEADAAAYMSVKGTRDDPSLEREGQGRLWGRVRRVRCFRFL